MLRWLVTALAFLTTPAFAQPADTARFADRPAEVSRHFAYVGEAQMHFRRAGMQADKTPLVLFHQSPSSSMVFVEYMAEMGADRMVYAPDTPGFGNSDLPTEPPLVEDYATAMIAFLDASNLAQVDLLGYHTGAAIAIELASRHPERVRKLIIVGLPAFTPEESAAFEAQPWPQPFDAEGEAVAASWRSTQKWWLEAGHTEAATRRSFDQKIANGPTAWWGARAALRYRTREALAKIEAPVLFVRPKDDLWESSLRALPELEALGAQRIDLPQFGFGLFEMAPEDMAAMTRSFLDGEQE